jgi:hypothetical protein
LHCRSDRMFRVSCTLGIKSEAIAVAGRGGLWGCEMLMNPHCLDNRLIDIGEVVSLTHRPRCIPWRPVELWDVGIPHCLDNRLTDIGEVVSLTHRPSCTPWRPVGLWDVRDPTLS